MNEEYITANEIQSITFEDLQQELFNLNTAQDKAKTLRDICIHFEMILKQMQVKIITNQKFKNVYNFDLTGLTDTNSPDYQMVMILGAQIVFEARSLITGETIDLLLGGIGANGNKLLEKKISQQDVLSNLTASLNEGAITLNSEISKLNETDNRVDIILNTLWQQIQVLSDYSQITSKNNTGIESGIKPYTYKTKDGQMHIRYRKYYKNVTRDFDVYAGYRGKRRVKYGYYKMKDGIFSFINTGWLYEWFRGYTLQSAEHVTKLLNTINDNSNATPLKEIVKGTDTLPGYKGGDIQVGQKQFQAKFTNLKIISFTSIATVIKNLQNILNLYIIATDPEQQRKQIQELLNLFTDNTNMKIINNDYSSRVDELLKILNPK